MAEIILSTEYEEIGIEVQCFGKDKVFAINTFGDSQPIYTSEKFGELLEKLNFFYKENQK